MKNQLIEEISPWHIQEENISRHQRDLLSRDSEARQPSPPPSSPESILRPSTLRKRIMSDIKQAYTAPVIRITEDSCKQKLVPRVYKLFEQHTDEAPIKRFSSQKDILASPRPANTVNIQIRVAKSRELRHSHQELRMKARSLKTFYHGTSAKLELKPKPQHKKQNPFALEIYSLKDRIESIFKNRGERLPHSHPEQSILAKLSKQAHLKSVMEPSPLAYQHVNNIRPVFSRNKEVRNSHQSDQRKFKPSGNHYLDKLIGKLQ